MTFTSSTLEAVTLEQLDVVTGGGLGSQIGSMFGDKGAKWGGIADSLFGMFKGSGGLGNLGSLFGGGNKSGGASPGSATSPGGATSGDPSGGNPGASPGGDAG